MPTPAARKARYLAVLNREEKLKQVKKRGGLTLAQALELMRMYKQGSAQ